MFKKSHCTQLTRLGYNHDNRYWVNNIGVIHLARGQKRGETEKKVKKKKHRKMIRGNTHVRVFHVAHLHLYNVEPFILLPTNKTCKPKAVINSGGGGYLCIIWVGRCRWGLKSRPIFIPNFVEKWDPFLYQSHKF